MTKNKSKGNARKAKRNQETTMHKRELIFKDVGQEYAQVTKMLGACRIQAYCFDGKTRLCQIRGNMRNKIFICVSDIILVGLREYQDDHADVILKYMSDEARLLVSYGELPATIKLHVDQPVNSEQSAENEEIPFEFTDNVDESESEESGASGESQNSENKSKNTQGSNKLQSKKFTKPNRPREIPEPEFESSDVDLDDL